MSSGLIVTLLGRKRDNRAKDMDLGVKYVEAFEKNIVGPLKTEVSDLRAEVASLKETILHLKDAIQKTNDCPHSAGCPVLRRLREQPTYCAGEQVERAGGEPGGEPGGA